jgi:DASH complex subunit DAD3
VLCHAQLIDLNNTLSLQQLSETLGTLSKGPIAIEIAEGLRLLERKVASVYTLMKASVYSIVLQQGQLEGGEGDTTVMAEKSGIQEGNQTVP